MAAACPEGIRKEALSIFRSLLWPSLVATLRARARVARDERKNEMFAVQRLPCAQSALWLHSNSARAMWKFSVSSKVLNTELTNSTRRWRSQNCETFARVNKAPLGQVYTCVYLLQLHTRDTIQCTLQGRVRDEAQ